MASDLGASSEFDLPGFRTRHLVDMQADNWAGIINLISWIQDESGRIVYLRTNDTGCGRIHVAIGVEAVMGGSLRKRLEKSNGFFSLRIEHLFIGESAVQTC